MKNKDLIEKLKQFDPETEVMVEENHSDLMYGIISFPAFEISLVHKEDNYIRIRAK